MKLSLRNTLLAAVALIAGTALAQDAELGLKQVWKAEKFGSVAPAEARYATGANGKVYFNNKAAEKIQTVDKNGKVEDFATIAAVGTLKLGTGIASDDAGNILVNLGFSGVNSGIWFVAVSADGQTQSSFQVTMPTGLANGRTDYFGNVAGDLFSEEGAYFYLAENTLNKVIMVKVANGQFVEAKASSANYNTTFDATAVAHPLLTAEELATSTNPEDNYYVRRRGGNDGKITKVENGKATVMSVGNPTTKDGFGAFRFGDDEIIILPAKINSPGSYGNEYQIIINGEVAEVVLLGTDTENTSSMCFSATGRKVSDTQAEIYLYVNDATSTQCAAMYTYTIEAPEEPEPQPELVGTYDIYMQKVLDFNGTLEGDPFASKLEIYKLGDKYTIKNENLPAEVPFTLMADKAYINGDAENEPIWGSFFLKSPIEYNQSITLDFNTQTGLDFPENYGLLWADFSFNITTAYLLMNELPKTEPKLVGTYDIYMQKVLDLSGNTDEPFASQLKVYHVDDLNYYIENENFPATVPFTLNGNTAVIKGDGEGENMWGGLLLPMEYNETISFEFTVKEGFNFKGDNGLVWMGSDGSMTAYIFMNELPKTEPEITPATFSNRIFSSVDQTMNEVTTTYPYYFEYNVTRNADATLTMDGKFTYYKEQPAGVVDTYSIYIRQDNFDAVGLTQGNSATTQKAYTDGETVKIEYRAAIALADVVAEIEYKVGDEKEMPELVLPEDPEQPEEPEITPPDVDKYEGGVALAQKNAYAYDIKVTPFEADPSQAVVQYRLNGKAASVSIQALIDGTPVDGAVTEGTTEHNNQVNVKLPDGTYTGTLTYEITVTPEATVTTPTVINDVNTIDGLYRFYAPYGLAINNCPDSETFGRIITNERSYFPDGTGTGSTIYHTHTSTKSIIGGLYAFDPQMQPIKAEDGSYCFQVGLGNNNDDKKTIFGDYFRLKFTADGRLYMSSTDLDKYGIYEIDANDLNATAQPVLEEKNQSVWAFDIYGTGDNRKLVMLTNDGEGNDVGSPLAWRSGAVNSYDLAEDNTASNYNLYKSLTHTNYGGDVNYHYLSIEAVNIAIDPDGKGFYLVHGRGGDQASEQVRAIHASIEDGTVDELVTRTNTNLTFVPRGGAVAYNHDGTLLAMASAVGKVTIYQASDVAAVDVETTNAPAPKGMTKVVEFSTTISTNTNGLAFDYANNLYAISNSGEKFISFQLPASMAGESSTVPSRTADAITLNNVTVGVGNVAIDTNEVAPAVYYNLNGVRMNGNNLPAGVYVKVVNGQSSKVIVR